jgi:hypothetical protein
MAEYRVYAVGTDGRLIGVEPLVSRNDNQAISEAKKLFIDRNVELWCGPRLVVRLSR